MKPKRRHYSPREEDLTEAPGLKPQLGAGHVPKRVGSSRALPVISPAMMRVAWNRLCANKPEYRSYYSFNA